MMARSITSNPPDLRAGAALLISSAAALFLLLHSHSLWGSPTLVPDRWPDIFYPLIRTFPREWVLAERDSAIGVLNTLLYLVIVATMFTAYLKTIRRLFSTHDTVLANPSSSLGFVLGVTAIVLLIFMLVPGMFSGD